MNALTWIRALTDFGSGYVANVPDGRIAMVVAHDHKILGPRWFVYARPVDCEGWGQPYELNGFSTREIAQEYVENGFQWPQAFTAAREKARENMESAIETIDRINGGDA